MVFRHFQVTPGSRGSKKRAAHPEVVWEQCNGTLYHSETILVSVGVGRAMLPSGLPCVLAMSIWLATVRTGCWIG